MMMMTVAVTQNNMVQYWFLFFFFFNLLFQSYNIRSSTTKEDWQTLGKRELGWWSWTVMSCSTAFTAVLLFCNVIHASKPAQYQAQCTLIHTYIHTYNFEWKMTNVLQLLYSSQLDEREVEKSCVLRLDLNTWWSQWSAINDQCAHRKFTLVLLFITFQSMDIFCIQLLHLIHKRNQYVCNGLKHRFYVHFPCKPG